MVQALHRRGQHDRADWVARELPDPLDSTKHAGILATLGINPAEVDDPAP